MPMTQRDWDIAQLEAQLKIQKIFDEWKQGFLGNRAPPPLNGNFASRNERFIPPELGEVEENAVDDTINGLIDNSVDNLGEGY